MSSAPRTHLTCRLDQGVQVATLTTAEIQGDDMAEALLRELIASVASLTAPRVVIDFRHVKSIAAAGLRSLLNFRRHLREKDGTLLLCGLSDEVAEVFFTTHLVTTTKSSIIPFAMTADVPTAVAHLSKGTSP